MSDVPIEDLSDTVADLKRRVEVLERRLAGKPLPPTMVWPKDGGPLREATAGDLAKKWDTGTYSEGDFVA